MMVDIDFFKQFNDTYGHLAGDECLQRIAAVIRQFMEGREGVAVRFGGEEFFICLFSCSRAQVLEAGETLRAAVERCGYPRGDPATGLHHRKHRRRYHRGGKCAPPGRSAVPRGQGAL